MISSRRDGLIDAARGLALAMIFVNHVPGNPLERLTSRNFGLSDATELFVFLAGYSAAIAYGRRYDSHGALHTGLRVWGRAFHLYILHLFSIVLAIAIVAAAAITTGDPHFLEWINLGPVFFDPVPAMIGLVTLGHQAGYFNILPLYIVLILATAFLLPLVRHRPAVALGLSLGLYLFVQCADLNLPNYPAGGTWFFNPLAWQFLFVIGLVCGDRARRGLTPVPYYPMLFAAAAGFLGIGLIMKLGHYYPAPDALPVPFFLFGQDKTFMTLPRLLHGLSLFYVAGHLSIREVVRRSGPIGRGAEMMGRHALLVFCAGSVLAILAQVALFVIDASALTAGVVVMGGLVGLVSLAMGRSWFLGISHAAPPPSLARPSSALPSPSPSPSP